MLVFINMYELIGKGIYILVKARREYFTGNIERGRGLEQYFL